MTSRELIALAREYATYDLPYSTIMLLNDLADALELVEAEKHYNQLVAVFADDVESVIQPLDLKSGCIFPSAPDDGEVVLLQRPCNPPTQEEVIARQEKAEIEIKEAKEKLFGHSSTRGQRAKLPLYEDFPVPQKVLDIIKSFKKKPNVPHWIVHDKCYFDPIYECSVCGGWHDDEGAYYDDLCPFCGAIMDEDAEEWIEDGYDTCRR